jgi:hypothetical protein
MKRQQTGRTEDARQRERDKNRNPLLQAFLRGRSNGKLSTAVTAKAELPRLKGSPRGNSLGERGRRRFSQFFAKFLRSPVEKRAIWIHQAHHSEDFN